MPRIVVLMPMIWSARNVVHSGVLERLVGAGAKVHLLMSALPPSRGGAEYNGYSKAASCEPMNVSRGKSPHGKAAVDSVILSAFHRRNQIKTNSIYTRWHHRHDSFDQRLRTLAVEALATLAQPTFAFDQLHRLSEAMFGRTHDLGPIIARLRRLSPDLIWSTVPVAAAEYPYILAARQLGIPIVTSILSFDNLTTRSILPQFDHYLVWNERMKDDLLQLYRKTSAEQVTITGTPQFDFHSNGTKFWSRSKTLEHLGLPSEARFFLYGAGHPFLAPEEPRLLADIARRMARDSILRDYRVVVRPHPLDDRSRWASISTGSDVVNVSPAWESDSDQQGWTLGTVKEQARFLGLLEHSDACINIASTISLDAAILDRPVIGIDFSAEPDSPREILYEEYETDHYRPLVDSGGIRLAHRWTELMEFMKRATTHPQEDAAKREQMVKTECGTVDGRAAERVATSLVRLANTSSRRAPVGALGG